jgi:proteic killer suppression protein
MTRGQDGSLLLSCIGFSPTITCQFVLAHSPFIHLLSQLHRVSSIEELRIPAGNRIEKLFGVRDGQWSIRINNQWRICFRFEGGDAYDIEIADYH